MYIFVVVVVVFVIFHDSISVCNSPGCPGTCFVDQAGLELTDIFLPLPLVLLFVYFFHKYIFK